MEDKNYLARLLNDELTAAEKQEIPEADLKLFEAIKEQSGMLTTVQRDGSGMLDTILSAPKQKPKLQLRTLRYAAIAASLLIFITIGFLFLNGENVKHHAGNGTEKELVLPDGSEVRLNSGSEITYDARGWDKNRRLELKGEAYFKVTKGKKFTVETKEGIIEVLGTQFNVKNRDGKLFVTCYEGRVRVANVEREQILTAGKSIIVDKNDWTSGDVTVERPEWMDKQIYFRAALLPEITAELERRYDISIKVVGRKSGEEFTGTVPANELDVALEVLSRSFDMSYKKLPDGSYQFN